MQAVIEPLSSPFILLLDQIACAFSRRREPLGPGIYRCPVAGRPEMPLAPRNIGRNRHIVNVIAAVIAEMPSLVMGRRCASCRDLIVSNIDSGCAVDMLVARR